MTISGTSVISLWSSLSMVRVTSAISLGFLVSVPAKMTSSILEALSVFVDCSPKTHLMESTIFDLPQPLGPRRDVMPSAKSICVLSAKLLNPLISSDLRNICSPSLLYLQDVSFIYNYILYAKRAI